MRKPSVRALMMAGIAAGAILVPAAPASAAEVGCVIEDGAYSCSTDYVAASSKITLSVLGTSDGKTVTCYVYDPYVNIRLQLSNSSPSVVKTESKSVPYNKHRLLCVRSVTSGGGSGRLYNF
jgi:hypothetical protein